MSRYTITIVVDDVKDRAWTLLKRALVNIAMLEGLSVIDSKCTQGCPRTRACDACSMKTCLECEGKR